MLYLTNQQIKIRVIFLAYNKAENGTAHQITQHIRCGLTPLPFGTLPSATSYMLGMLYAISPYRSRVRTFTSKNKKMEVEKCRRK